jgi:hypothetical protein
LLFIRDVKSILPPEFSGVIYIGGRRGVGKTYLASTADDPKNELFLDYEEKGEGLNSQLGFGAYHSMATRDNVFLETLQIIDSLKKDQFTVAILDNISPLELSMKGEAIAHAQDYAKEFGLSVSNILSGRFGGASSVVNHLISSKISKNLRAKGIKVIIVTAHVKPFWGSGGPIPNKWNVLGADKWQELSILTLTLIPGDYAPIPSALVNKEQLGSISFKEGRFEIKRRLPFRIPKCNTFASVTQYLKEPVDLASPKEGETPLDSEIASYSEELTNEQLAMNNAALEIQQAQLREAEEEEQRAFDLEYNLVRETVQEHVQKAPPVILKHVQEKYGDSYTLGNVLSILKEE